MDDLNSKFSKIFNVKAIIGFLMWTLAIVFICVVSSIAIGVEFQNIFTKELWAKVGTNLAIKYLATSRSRYDNIGNSSSHE